MSNKSKTYFDQNGLKGLRGQGPVQTGNQIESSLDKYVEEYKARKLLNTKQNQPTRSDNPSDTGFGTGVGVEQAKFAFYETLLGYHKPRPKYPTNFPPSQHVSSKAGAKINSIARFSTNARNQPQHEIVTETETKTAKIADCKKELKLGSSSDVKKKRKSINIDTSNMLLLQKHQLNLKVSSAFKYTKMLGNRQEPLMSAIDEDFNLNFEFPNSKLSVQQKQNF